MHHCQRHRGSESTSASNTKLYGDYHAVLCCACLNEWNIFIIEHPIWVQTKETEVLMLYYTRTAPSLDECKELVNKMAAVKKVSHAIAKTWMLTAPHAPHSDT